MKVRISIEGTAPLLCHNIQLADPLNPIAKAMKAISAKRKKTEDDHEQLARLEFEGGLYLAPGVGPYVPGVNIEKSIVEGARITKQGKQVERGLFVTDNEVPLLYQGPRAVEDLWADVNFRSSMAVKVGQARVMRTRPIFRSWALDVDAEVDPALLDMANLSAICEDAGRMVGIGDYRPRFGRFDVEVHAL
ncbi:MAG TPA: hypothetical protein VHK88_20115 [Aquihabitans sp.]|nr:hypothetical protein [Aquihabitans sp.]